MWIKRDIAASISNNRDPIQVIRGPRQCGKSSLALHLGPDFKEVSLDDPSLRDLAQSDPELFLRQFGDGKLFIDEAQYAPRLFPSLKRRADLYKRQNDASAHATILRLTGSNQILMDRQVKESLAGRAAFFDMNTLSVREILAAKNTSIQNILFTGGWPELHATKARDTKKFLDDYITSYVEKDVVLAAGIHKRREFLKFVRLLAGRVGQILDFSSLAGDAGVDAKTTKEWSSILETMHIIALVPPYSTNLSTRLIKSPKIYFLDTGLACRLQGWSSPEPILTSPQQGHLFENLVFAEIYKTVANYQLDVRIYHWRSRDGEEIDFLLEFDPQSHIFVEAKVSPRSLPNLDDYPQVKKVFKKQPTRILCHQEGGSILGQNVPLSELGAYLLKADFN